MNSMLSVALLFLYSFSTLSAASSSYPLSKTNDEALAIKLSCYPAACGFLDYQGCGLIHYATQNNTIEAICNIAEHSFSDLNMKTDTGLTPLDIALIEDQMNALVALWILGADLSYSMYKNKINNCLIEKINTPYSQGNYLIHYAIKENWNMIFFEKILTLQENINVKNTNGSTPLHLAMLTKRDDIVDCLLSYSIPDISIPDISIKITK